METHSVSHVRIALPSKGRMEGETSDFLANCGMRVKKTNPRQYSATMPAFPNVQILFQRPRDIPVSVAAGDVDLGITGYDTLAEVESNPEYAESVITIHEGLGYGECSLVLAVPASWTDVQITSDLPTRFADISKLRVATKYVHTVARFLEERALGDIRIVYADGALESAPNVGYADFIADISSTGTTLRENNLRQLDDGKVIDSQAVFIGNRHSLANKPDVLSVTEQMLELIEAYRRAENQFMIFANMRGDTQHDIATRISDKSHLSGLQYPTISPLITSKDDAGGWWSVSIVVAQVDLFAAIRQIRSVGGSGVVVTPVTYIFEERPVRIQKLLEALQQEET